MNDVAAQLHVRCKGSQATVNTGFYQSNGVKSGPRASIHLSASILMEGWVLWLNLEKHLDDIQWSSTSYMS